MCLSRNFFLGFFVFVISSFLFGNESSSDLKDKQNYNICPESDKDCMGVCGGRAVLDLYDGCILPDVDRDDDYSYYEIPFQWQSGADTNVSLSDERNYAIANVIISET